MKPPASGKYHGCPARRTLRQRRRRAVLGIMVILAIAVVCYGEAWVLTEAPPTDLSFTAASVAARVLVTPLN
jgi:uncharacterized membrane protein AbrB (regulator of aidB expression)